MFKILLSIILTVSFSLSALAEKPSPSPLPNYDDPKLLDLVKKHLNGNEDVVRRFIRRLGDRTIEIEFYISADGSQAQASQIMCDFMKLPDWTLKDINKTPDGKPYRFQVTGLKMSAGKDDEAKNPLVAMADLEYLFDLPLFRYAGKRAYRLQCERMKDGFVIHAEAPPLKSSIVESSKGFMKVFPAPQQSARMWIYLRGAIKLNNSVLYELLPENVVNREASERAFILLGNYLKEEDRRLELKKAQNLKADDVKKAEQR